MTFWACGTVTYSTSGLGVEAGMDIRYVNIKNECRKRHVKLSRTYLIKSQTPDKEIGWGVNI